MQGGGVGGAGGVEQVGIFAGFGQAPVSSRWREPGAGETCSFLTLPCDLGPGWVQLDGFVHGQAGFAVNQCLGSACFRCPHIPAAPLCPARARSHL